MNTCWISTIALISLQFCVYHSVVPSYASLHSALRNYHELWPENFTTIVKRDTTTGHVRFKLVSFPAFNKFFVLHLTPGSPVLSDQFQVKTVDSKGNMHSFQIETNNFYTGYCNGYPSNVVDAVDIDGIWIAQITVAGDSYSIEPLTHYYPESSTRSMVIYKVSDIRAIEPGPTAGQPSPFCQVVELKPKSRMRAARSRKKEKRHSLNNSILSAPWFRQTSLRGSTIRQQRRKQITESTRSVHDNILKQKPAASRDQFVRPASESHSHEHDQHPTSESHSHQHDQHPTSESHSHEHNQHPTSESHSHQHDQHPTSESHSHQHDQHPTSESHSHEHHQHPKRPRRQNFVTYDTCDLYAIADFEFYQGMGHKSLFRTSSLLIHMYQYVDRIFRRTQFDDLTNIGIALIGILVHTNYTEANTQHYNMFNNQMSGLQTLFALAELDILGSACVVHLSTHRNFGGTLGMASTANTVPDWSNGVCGKDNRNNMKRNMGLSTTLTLSGTLLPLRTYMLVVTHELGHNFGSQHDPETANCYPTKGGKYIMWAFSGQSFGENSCNFSPCSRQAIALVLKSKAHLCFKPKSVIQHICGNSVLDPGEDCDRGNLNSDPCCTPECRFAEGAICSPLNHVCCTKDCRTAPPTQLCFSTDDKWCYETPFCSGTSFQTCPMPKPLPDNSTCYNHGRCLSGRCVTLCEQRGMSQSPPVRMTECSHEEDRQAMCRHGCWDVSKSDFCDILDLQVVEGTPCLFGFCKNGTCESPKSDDFSFENYPDDLINMSVSSYSCFCCWIFLLTQVFGQLVTRVYISYS